MVPTIELHLLTKFQWSILSVPHFMYKTILFVNKSGHKLFCTFCKIVITKKIHRSHFLIFLMRFFALVQKLNLDLILLNDILIFKIFGYFMAIFRTKCHFCRKLAIKRPKLKNATCDFF